MKSPEDEVRAASARFYAEINKMTNGDASGMAAVWLHKGDVTTMHPIGGREIGWDQVQASWQAVAKVATEGRVRIEDQQIRVAGDMAYEIGVERGSLKLAGHRVEIDDRFTNVYRKADGTWKIVHHHTDLSPAMLEILAAMARPS